MRAQPLAERIRRHVVIDAPSGCWLWTGRKDRTGYGRMNVAGRSEAAHRVSYRTFRGPIPPGLVLDHVCRTRACVNPDHLDPVSRSENMRRAAEHGAWAGTHTSRRRTPAEVLEIVAALEAGETRTALARRLGLSYSMIADIDRGQSWCWLTRRCAHPQHQPEAAA